MRVCLCETVPFLFADHTRLPCVKLLKKMWKLNVWFVLTSVWLDNMLWKLEMCNEIQQINEPFRVWMSHKYATCGNHQTKLNIYINSGVCKPIFLSLARCVQEEESTTNAKDNLKCNVINRYPPAAKNKCLSFLHKNTGA